MKAAFLSPGDLAVLLSSLSGGYTVLAPVTKDKRQYLQLLESIPRERACASIGEVRPCEPLKAFYFRARERVASGFSNAVPEASEKPICIIGVKACDLKGFEVLDSVFLDDERPDPLYRRHREENLVISSDCPRPIDTCFCMALHTGPFPRQGFDINLSEIAGGFVVEAGSTRGETLMESTAPRPREATQQEMDERERLRRQAEEKVRGNIQEHRIPAQELLEGAFEQSWESGLWGQEASTCVECGACNTICPTCHCFLLSDQKKDDEAARFRIWDSCLIKDFAKVAGGANPRPQLWMRLRNRFEKKFDFFPKTRSLYACTGCGRCISACPGRIDIRRILGGMARNG
jgi:sulfhydrogenase subunit beta (sulfur reductase)